MSVNTIKTTENNQNGILIDIPIKKPFQSNNYPRRDSVQSRFYPVMNYHEPRHKPKSIIHFLQLL